ncbi:hypothetical protein B0H21DRAFT_149256 [Amylocystis lapponica]|nr:hypothetical protein B0H21DRAFT_149256 [Amylocystis lapponica]
MRSFAMIQAISHQLLRRVSRTPHAYRLVHAMGSAIALIGITATETQSRCFQWNVCLTGPTNHRTRICSHCDGVRPEVSEEPEKKGGTPDFRPILIFGLYMQNVYLGELQYQHHPCDDNLTHAQERFIDITLLCPSLLVVIRSFPSFRRCPRLRHHGWDCVGISDKRPAI